MRVCIFGAGAIGGFIGARLAAAGVAQLSVVARGDTLAALQQHGFRLRNPDGSLTQAPVRASATPAELGEQDLVIIAVKGQAMAAAAPAIGPLLGPQTVLLPAMNGIPWWFSAGVPELGAAPLGSVDPGGRIAQALPASRIIGCVVHASTSCPEPGLVAHQMGQKLIIGEPAAGPVTPRVQQVAELLRSGGLEVVESPELRRELWYKLWGNLTTNPVSAITGATVDLIIGDPLLRTFCASMMEEAARVGARIGCRIEQTPADRHRITASLGAFKTSMLQDAEAGRTIELDGIVGAVREIAQRVGEPTPGIDALLGLTRVFAQVHGLYPRPQGAA